MKITRLYHKAFCVMQWSIGFSRGSIEQIIKEKNCALQFKWMPLKDSGQSIADPFLFKDEAENINLLYEDFSMTDSRKYGRIVIGKVNERLEVSNQKELLDTGSHSSYPFVAVEDGITYIIPETSAQNNAYSFEFDFKGNQLYNKNVLLGKLPLLDSTILKHNDKYWLFATQSNPAQFEHSRLYIYFSDHLAGPYKSHPNNPVKKNIDGSRPAGNFITVSGEIYRPAQNCSIHYGESISINKVTKLSETEFEEEFLFKIKPDYKSEFNAGIHTINAIDDIIVVDGIKMVFAPFTKWKLFIQKKLNKR